MLYSVAIVFAVFLCFLPCGGNLTKPKAKWRSIQERAPVEYDVDDPDIPVPRHLTGASTGKFVEVDSFDSPLGHGVTLKRFKEEIDGLEVHDSILGVRKNNGQSMMLTGQVLEDADTDLAGSKHCDLSDSAIEEIVRAYHDVGKEVDLTMGEENNIVWRGEEGPARKATKVKVLLTWTDTKPEKSRINIYTIDTCKQDVLDVELKRSDLGSRITQRNLMDDEDTTEPKIPRGRKCPKNNVHYKGGNPKAGSYPYGYEPYCVPITPTSRKGYCRLGANKKIRVVNMNHTKDKEMSREFTFRCKKGFKDERVNGGNAPLLDAYFHTANSWKMHEEWYHLDMSKIPKIEIKAHYGESFDNAFQLRSNLLFGDGAGVFYPIGSADDAVAHEFNHLIVQYTSQLAYKGETGGLCESFADMAGQTFSVYLGKKPVWLPYGKILKHAEALRYMRRPSKDGYSIDNLHQMNKKVNVHHASGLYNRVFYLMHKLIGVRRAYGIFLLANRMYWHSTTDFEHAACDVIRASYELGYDMWMIAKPFNEVFFTFKHCPDFEKFITVTLKTSGKQTGIQVSKYRQPIYELEWPPNAKSVTVRCQSSVPVKVHASNSPRLTHHRAIKTTGQEGRTSSVKVTRKFIKGTVYVALTSKAHKEHEASCEVLTPEDKTEDVPQDSSTTEDVSQDSFTTEDVFQDSFPKPRTLKQTASKPRKMPMENMR